MTSDTKWPVVFFASVFTGKMSLQECQVPEISPKVQSEEDLRLMEEDRARY